MSTNNIIRAVEIETIAHCNFFCKFCPYPLYPKDAKAMSMELFEEILDKAFAHQTISTVSINSYTEPTIDKLFMQRCEMIKAKGLILLLHTNGSGLTVERLEQLKALGNISQITINMPTLDPIKYTAVTGYKNINKIITIIDKAIELGFVVDLSVNGTDEEVREALPALKERWPSTIKHPCYLADPPVSITNDRVGLISAVDGGKYDKKVNITTPRLEGCEVPNSWLYINRDGDLFMCCEDFQRKTVYGNIKDGSINDLLNSKRRCDMLEQINGMQDAPEDLICRKCLLMAIQTAVKERTREAIRNSTDPEKL